MITVHISIIIPVYGCGESLVELCHRLETTLTKITNNYEILLVNDNSPDSSWETILFLSEQDKRIKGLNLSRNFGQHHAITAGLDYTNADWTVVMDCDLQDTPEEILKFYQKATEGYDLVVGRRVNRQDSFFKKLKSRLFYFVYNYLTDSSINNELSNYGIYSRNVIINLRRFKEQHRVFGLFVHWSGFNRCEIPIVHSKRIKGKSSYSFRKLLTFALDNILSYSNKPLLLTVKIGFFISILSFFYSIWIALNFFIHHTPVEGWTSIIVSLYFLSGLIIGSIGILGLYIGKVFDGVKNRPLYIVKETTFTKNNSNENL